MSVTRTEGRTDRQTDAQTNRPLAIARCNSVRRELKLRLFDRGFDA